MKSSSKKDKDSEGECETTDGNESVVSDWRKAPLIPFGERLEIKVFKCLTYVPVMITFSLFTLLVIFYVFVSIIINSLAKKFHQGLTVLEVKNFLTSLLLLQVLISSFFHFLNLTYLLLWPNNQGSSFSVKL